MEFKISRESIQQFEDLIAEKNEKELLEILKDKKYRDGRCKTTVHFQ